MSKGRTYVNPEGVRRRIRPYTVWQSMLSRCESPKNKSWAAYGGRGIKVCAEWHDFDVFLLWALRNGYDGTLTIDRIDNDGDYKPSNCRFISLAENLNKTSRSRYLEAFGESKTMADWVRDPRCLVSYKTFERRLRDQWPIEQIITTPSQVGKGRQVNRRGAKRVR